MSNNPMKNWKWLLAGLLAVMAWPVAQAQTPTLDPPRKWGVSIGGSNFDFITDAVADGQGNLYVTGYTNSPNFPATLPGSPGAGYDVFVAKVDIAGNVIWATRYGSAQDDFANAIALDAAGRVVVVGKTSALAGFMALSSFQGAQEDVLVMRFLPTGSLLWGMKYGGAANDEAFGLDIGPQNRIVVVGTSASSDFPTTSALWNGSSSDAFLMELDTVGARQWAIRYGGASFETANDVAVSNSGEVYVCGETGSFNFPENISTYSGSGGAKAFVAKFDATGTRLWAMRYGGASVERAYGLLLRPSGELLVTGYTTSTAFPVTISGMGSTGLDAFLLSLDGAGSRNWARRIGGSLDDLGLTLATDSLGNIFMGGETQSSNFPATNRRFQSAGRDQILVKFSPTGQYQWSMPFGGTLNDFTGGVQRIAGNKLYLAGHTQSNNYPQTLTGTGGSTARGSILLLQDCLGQSAAFSFSSVCDGETVVFQNLSVKGTSDTLASRWWFGDGDSSDVIHPTHVYAQPGAYAVRLRTTSPCGVDSFFTDTVHVYPNPIADFSWDLSCETYLTYFHDESALDSILGSMLVKWDWSFGDGGTDTVANPAHIYSSAGTYPVSLAIESQFGCRDTIADSVEVYHTPSAIFGFAHVCDGDTVFFSDSSSVDVGNLVHWNYDFGDGSGDTVPSPSHLYAMADSFWVTLTVESDQGCMDTIVQEVRVLPVPVVAFGFDEVCWPDTVTFSDSTTIVGDTLAQWLWTFGDGDSATVVNPSHDYAGWGQYHAWLHVTSGSGCSDTLGKDLMVHDKPVADFGVMPVCFPETSLFMDSSSVMGDSIAYWSWDFGDGAMDTVPSPGHAYAIADTFTVTLWVESGFGCRDTVSHPAIVYPKPSAAFTTYNVCFPEAVVLSDSSWVIGDLLAQWNWDFGDGNTGSGDTLSHAYAQFGSYTPTLVVETASGCRDTIMDSVTVYPKPEAAFGVDFACLGDTVFFSDSSTVGSGSILSWIYDLGDGTMSMQPDTLHIYATAGTVTASLMVETDKGCRDTTERSSTTWALPVLNLTLHGYADICQGDTIQIEEPQAFVHYAWNTSDTVPSIFVASQSDFFTLTVTDTNNCVQSDSMEIRFHPVPKPNPIIVPGPVVVACESDSLVLDAGGSYDHYFWSDGDTVRTRRVFADASLSVLVYNGFGCADTSDTVSVTILANPAAPVISQVGDTLWSSAAASYQWYLDGLPIVGATQQWHYPRATGNYWVEIADSAGCPAASDALAQTVGLVSPVATSFTVYPNPFVDVLNIELPEGGEISLRLIDGAGRVLVTQSLFSSSNPIISVPVPDLVRGWYMLEVLKDGEIWGRKMVVK